jgi:hypothetical protein
MEEFNQIGQQEPIQPIERPTAVTVFGVLNCVFGGLGLLCTPFSMIFLTLGDRSMEMVQGYKIYLLIVSVIGMGLSAWLLSLGIGLLKFKGWARHGSIIYAIIVIVWGIIGAGLNIVAVSFGWMTAPQEQLPFMIGSMMCGGIAGLIYPVLLLIFMRTEKVKQAFEQLEAR